MESQLVESTHFPQEMEKICLNGIMRTKELSCSLHDLCPIKARTVSFLP